MKGEKDKKTTNQRQMLIGLTRFMGVFLNLLTPLSQREMTKVSFMTEETGWMFPRGKKDTYEASFHAQ